jgi:hypothetical protein
MHGINYVKEMIFGFVPGWKSYFSQRRKGATGCFAPLPEKKNKNNF